MIVADDKFIFSVVVVVVVVIDDGGVIAGHNGVFCFFLKKNKKIKIKKNKKFKTGQDRVPYK